MSYLSYQCPEVETPQKSHLEDDQVREPRRILGTAVNEGRDLPLMCAEKGEAFHVACTWLRQPFCQGFFGL